MCQKCDELRAACRAGGYSAAPTLLLAYEVPNILQQIAERQALPVPEDHDEAFKLEMMQEADQGTLHWLAEHAEEFGIRVIEGLGFFVEGKVAEAAVERRRAMAEREGASVH